MTIFQSLILAVVQGIAEFLPISSSGHLNLAQYFLHLEPSLSLDIFLNTATLLSVLYYFRHKFSFFKKNFLYILIGSIPAGLVGVLFKSQIELIFSNINLLPFFFLITAMLMFLTRFIKIGDRKLTVVRSLAIGLFQAMAILPGVSRSGSTVFAGLLMGLSPINAFNYSFSLFIPASFGAVLLDLKHVSLSLWLGPAYIISFVVTFLVGVVSLRALESFLSKNRTWYFSFYVLAVAIITFIIFY